MKNLNTIIFFTKKNIDFDNYSNYNIYMNNTILKFVMSHDIDLKTIEKFDDIKVDNKEDINNIIDENKFYSKFNVLKNICIADIKGYDYKYVSLNNDNFLENMSRFFDENGFSYEKRSISMLDYSTSEIIDKLSNSFRKEPICLLEADKHKYVIGNNGLHRYHVLKAHYLKELSLLDKNDLTSIKSLRDKYTIETRVDEIDYFKTYSSYILKLIGELYDDRLKFESELDEYYQPTQNIIMRHYNDFEKSKILNDNQLLSLLKSSVSEILLRNSTSKKISKQFINSIKQTYEKFESFKEYCLEYLPEVIHYIDKTYKYSYSYMEEIPCRL